MTIDRPADEIGAAAQITAESVLAAIRTVTEGRVFDLDPGRFPGMPRHHAQPPFDVVTYRTPAGQRIQRDLEFLAPERNSVNFGFLLEMVTTSMHMGAHIDALCHVTCGPDSAWYGGHPASEHVGDKGALTCDASKIPPLVTRGVLLDIARALDIDVLPPSYSIASRDISKAMDRQGVELHPGDVVLLRTGQMSKWPEVREGNEAGLSLEAAQWLSQLQPVAIGADNSALEVSPSGIAGSPQPVHLHLMIERGIYILEWISLEELASAGLAQFLFLCLPLKIQGATGSLVRPIAIA